MHTSNIHEPTTIVGLMSGTSLDGLDMACVRFWADAAGQFQYKIIATDCIKYTDFWQKKLHEAQHLSAFDYALLNVDLGKYFGNKTREFIQKNHLTPQYIASHGHTIFHQPHLSLTTQIGSPPHIAAATGLPTIADFRTLDVAMGGQGAPLVPIGDLLLFSHFDVCINIGGIANISYQNNDNQRIAYDICPANMVLNYFCNKIKLPYDNGGNIAQKSTSNPRLLNLLNDWQYYTQNIPKSLGKEQIFNDFLPIINDFDDTIPNKIATVTHHIATQIANSIQNAPHHKNILITGGGALNGYLLKIITQKTTANIHTHSRQMIDFKEAVIFAFLGYLRIINHINTLKTVTGATQNTVGGAVYHPVFYPEK